MEPALPTLEVPTTGQPGKSLNFPFHSCHPISVLFSPLFSHQIPAFFMMTRSQGHSSLERVIHPPLSSPKPPLPPGSTYTTTDLSFIFAHSLWLNALFGLGSWGEKVANLHTTRFLSLWLCFFYMTVLICPTVTLIHLCIFLWSNV